MIGYSHNSRCREERGKIMITKDDVNFLVNEAWRFWDALPEPKLSYSDWWYGEREQCLCDVFKGEINATVAKGAREG